MDFMPVNKIIKYQHLSSQRKSSGLHANIRDRVLINELDIDRPQLVLDIDSLSLDIRCAIKYQDNMSY